MVHFSVKIWHLAATILVTFRWDNFSKIAFLAICEIFRSLNGGMAQC